MSSSRLAWLGVGVLVAACSHDATPPDFGKVEDATLVQRPATPTLSPTVGATALGISATRDAYLYVPASYSPSAPAPLLVLLHGSGVTGQQWMNVTTFTALADELGVVLLAPSSNDVSWDVIIGGKYTTDAHTIDLALAETFKRVNVDPTRIGLAGFADGGSYALSLGLINGDLFGKVIAFAPAQMFVPWRRGNPGIYVSHGTQDEFASESFTRNVIVSTLIRGGYTVAYYPFTGGHEIPPDLARQAMTYLKTGVL